MNIRDVRGKRSYESDGSAREDMEGEGTESSCPSSADADEEGELALELSSERQYHTYQMDERTDSDLEVEEEGWENDTDFRGEDEPLLIAMQAQERRYSINTPSARSAAGVAVRAERKSSLPKKSMKQLWEAGYLTKPLNYFSSPDARMEVEEQVAQTLSWLHKASRFKGMKLTKNNNSDVFVNDREFKTTEKTPRSRRNVSKFSWSVMVRRTCWRGAKKIALEGFLETRRAIQNCKQRSVFQLLHELFLPCVNVVDVNEQSSLSHQICRSGVIIPYPTSAISRRSDCRQQVHLKIENSARFL